MLRLELFWYISQCRVVILYRRFGTRRNSFWTSWPLKMGPISCPEKSVHNYHPRRAQMVSTSRLNPEIRQYSYLLLRNEVFLGKPILGWFLGAFVKWRKAYCSFVISTGLSLCPCVCVSSRIRVASIGRISVKFDDGGLLWKYVAKIRIWLKSDKKYRDTYMKKYVGCIASGDINPLFRHCSATLNILCCWHWHVFRQYTQKKWLHFHGKNGYSYSPNYFIIRMLPVLFFIVVICDVCIKQTYRTLQRNINFTFCTKGGNLGKG
jgi:hypothetical protein